MMPELERSGALSEDQALRDIPTQRDKLALLEIGRAAAALTVVLHHADQATAHFSDIARERLFMWGQYGVDFFFVLSGFIIFYTHRHDGYGWSSARLYAFKRISRIYIPYLPVALAYMGLLLIFQQGALDERPWSLWATFTLLPSEKSSTLTVAWTLTYELMFYAFFLLAFVSRRLLLVASLIWSLYLLAVLTGHAARPDSATLAVLSDPIILEFFCGALAAWLFARVPTRMRGGILALGLVLLGLVIVFWSGDRAFLGPLLALIVLAAAMAPCRNPDRVTDALIFLGAASYSIYLVHSPVISILARVLQPLEQRFVIFCACVLIGTALGMVFHLLLERPALRAAQRFRPVLRSPGA
jgi:exopolysaccharide production protein ExoZ